MVASTPFLISAVWKHAEWHPHINTAITGIAAKRDRLMVIALATFTDSSQLFN